MDVTIVMAFYIVGYFWEGVRPALQWRMSYIPFSCILMLFQCLLYVIHAPKSLHAHWFLCHK